ncbi:hypothetical protein IWQ62_002217 [Dispira parvispora]|uniref:Peroxisomal adenine nucleotide transporter 1 n=1 Tax=Dispira parvispora TaxID=1520584 RepID=A0A9W8ART5_9FUNG|nr:hypothetical protein IWQ62_002217 [Dispira parvispora]
MARLSKETLPPFGQALTGATSAALALLCVYPLDTIKTRLQVQTNKPTETKDLQPDGTPDSYVSVVDALKKIYSSEGIRGFYAGLGAGLLGQTSTNFAYFYWYSFIRKFYQRRIKGGRAISTPMELVLGALAAAIAQLFTTPIAVTATRQQTASRNERKSMLVTAREVVQEDGWTGLWKGLRPSLVLVVNPSITYGAFERIKAWMAPTSTGPKCAGQSTPAPALSAVQVFLAGALSKTLATIITYPYIMAKVRLQWKPPKTLLEGSGQAEGIYTSAMDVLHRAWKQDGWLGWYKGMGTQITKAVLTQALLLMIKDKLEAYVIFLFVMLRRARTV